MTRVNSMLLYDEFTSPKKLDDSYILGYYCQRQVFIEEKEKRIEQNAKNKLKNLLLYIPSYISKFSPSNVS